MNYKSSSAGILFSLLAGLPATAQVFTVQHSFDNTPDGANPMRLALSNGLLYGSTAYGGTSGNGSLFLFDTNALNFATFYNFTGAPNNGETPNDVLVAGSVVYGTTQFGGTNNYGAIYSVGTNGLGFVPLYSFTNSPDGATPLGGLVLSGGALFGVTHVGGAGAGGGAGGTIFTINTNGTGYATLHSFTNTPDGAQPQNGLVLGGATLYGTTVGGGLYGNGTVFAINTNGSDYTNLYSFSNAPDAVRPYGGLALSAGVLYGLGSGGGSNQTGAIFALGTNGSGYRILYDFSGFSGNTDGDIPQSTLTASGSCLYGTTISGGAGFGGTIFIINTNGTGFTVIGSFTNATSGSDLLSGVIRAGNALWGTANQGGTGGFGTLFDLPLPAITQQPQSLAVTNTSPATFTVNAADDSPIHYQWFLNTNTLLNAQTNTTLAFASATTGNAGAYSVVASDGVGSVTSSPAILTVTVPGTRPAITLQPQNLTVAVSNTASFTNAATGSAPLFYQWYFNTNTVLNSATGPILVLPSVATNQAGYYTVIVTNLYGSATSAPASLTVTTVIAPAITQQPQDYTVTNGYDASFTNVASGTAPLFYQWYLNTNTPVNGGTGPILTLAPATTNSAGYYTVVVTNSAGSVTSAPAKLTVIVPVIAPGITQQPQNLTVTNGFTASFTNVATGTAPLFYQWYFNTNTPVNGGTGPVLTLAPATTNSAGYYTVVVTNSAGSVTSAPAKLTVIVPVALPVITQQPQNITVTNGYDAAFTNVASSTGPLFYQWYFNTNTPVTGGTNAILVVPFVTTNQAGYYGVIVTNSAGSVTSAPAKLTVITTKPIIIGQPQPVLVTNGSTVSFSVAAAGLGPLSYQWYTNRVAPGYLIHGAASNPFTFTANTNLQGGYLVLVSDSLGKATSSPALLTVITTPVITLDPLNVVVTNGDPVNFTSAATGPGVLSYQWLFQTNTLLGGATNTSLAFTNTYSSLAGYYAMRVTNSYGSVTSSYARLTVSTQLNFLSFDFSPAEGSASFALANAVNSTNRLWASSNLAGAWFAIATNVMATNGLWFYTDPNTARTNRVRLYRFSTP